MTDYRELSRLTERIIHKYVQLEKKPRDYGGILLTQTEIHTIATVGDYPGVNVTRLAQMRGITKGAASQMVYKLVDKGFIKKDISPNSDTEVSLTLTRLGQKAYDAHAEHHHKSGIEFFSCFTDIPTEEQIYLLNLLKRFDQAMDEKLKNISNKDDVLCHK